MEMKRREVEGNVMQAKVENERSLGLLWRWGIVVVLLGSKGLLHAESGPFLGNATRNSWVDQTSIVIWTRTTAQAEFEAKGRAFLEPTKAEMAALAQEEKWAELLSRQLPEGAGLEEMIGACPGAPGQVRLAYFPATDAGARITSSWQPTHAGQDFTRQWTLTGLEPNTFYTTVVEARGVEGGAITARTEGGFRTAPRAEDRKDLTFCFTTCHDFIRRDDGLNGHQIYPAMLSLEPDFVVHAGDIEYYDKPRPYAMTKELMRFKWGRIFALPSNRQFYHTTSSYFLKDDHDTLKNDCWAGQSYGNVTFEEGVQLFNVEQFPTRDPRFQSVRWGEGLQVWFLEGRDYRSPNNMPDGPGKTILGDEQKEWLFLTLSQSTATFKLICSPTPIVGPDRKNKKDNHANTVFAHEGQEMRRRLAEFENVIVLCGDRHWQYASEDPAVGLWEFGCGPGSEQHQLGWKAGDERPEHQFLRVKGGFLSGTLDYPSAGAPAQLTLRHRTVRGAPVSEFEFPR